MIYLLLSILSSTAIVLIFKWFKQWGIDTFQAIVFNYWVCVLCGWIALGHFPVEQEFWKAFWFPYALFLGVVFISGFNIVAQTVQKFNVTLATVMQKMSMLMTVIFALLVYGETLNVFKGLGILAAAIAIIMVNVSPSGKLFVWKVERRVWLLLPIFTLLTSAIIEIVFLHLEKQTGQSGDLQFVSFLFGTAGLLGTFPLLVSLLNRKRQLSLKNIGAGVLLGVPNFCSIYFLLKSLGIGWDGSIIFPVNNVAIIALSSLLAWLIFKERLSRVNNWGVIIAILAIILITLGA